MRDRTNIGGSCWSCERMPFRSAIASTHPFNNLKTKPNTQIFF